MSYEKAVRHFNQKEYPRAQKELEASLEKMPTSTEAHFLLAKTHYALKAFPEALAAMEQAKATHAVSADRLVAAQEERRAELRRRGRTQEVIVSDMRQLLGRTTDPSARKMLEAQIATAENVKFEIDQALLEFPPVATGIPADYFFFHGNILLRLRRLDEAVSEYREALKLEPAHPEASNNLASLYYAARQPELARQVLEQAEAKGVKVNPELKQAVLEALEP